MHIAVIGAGAVGGYFGGKLAKNGEKVTFIVREKRFKSLQENDLRVKSIDGDFTVKPELARSAEEAGNPDFVLLSVKNYHLEGAMPILSELVKKGTKIVLLLNGVQHMKVLTEAFGKESVLGGLCYIESTLSTEGEIVHTSAMQDIVFGRLSEEVDASLLSELETAIREAGINVKLSEDILTDMWKKYIFLSTLSGITSATRKPIGAAQNDPVTDAFLEDTVKEIVTIAQAEHERIPPETASEILGKCRSLPAEMTSSMHRDLEKGLPLELESLHGGLLEMAKKHDLHVPCMRAIYALLHPYADGTSA